MAEVFKYMCPTNRNETDNCFRESCTLCNCAPYGKMVLDPGKKISDQEEEFKCPHTGVALNLIDSWEESLEQTTIIGFAMSKDQIRADRKQRANKHFREEVFPTLGRDEQRHHVKKDPTLKPTIDISMTKQIERSKKIAKKK